MLFLHLVAFAAGWWAGEIAYQTYVLDTERAGHTEPPPE